MNPAQMKLLGQRMREKEARKKARKLNKNQVKQTKRLINNAIAKQIEISYINNQVSAGASYTWVYTALTDIPQATTAQVDIGLREGDTVTPLSLDLTYSWIAGDTTNVGRIVVFRVKKGPTTNNYFTDDTNAYSVYSKYSFDLRNQIEVLYDRMHDLSVVGSNNVVTRHKLINLKRRTVHYTAGGVVAQGGGIYIAYCSDSSAISHPNILFNTRVKYLR